MEKENIKNNEEEMPNMDQDGGVGPVVGSVIVVILILIAGLYLIDSLKEKVENNEPEEVTPEEINPDTSDTSIETIEAELQSDGLMDIDIDLKAIEEEFDN